MSKRKVLKRILIGCVGGVLAASAVFCSVSLGKGGKYYDEQGNYTYIDNRHSVRYTMEHPAFEGFGDFILPWKDWGNQTFSPFFNWEYLCFTAGFNTKDVVSGLNFMIDKKTELTTLKYDYYTTEDKKKDSMKNDTGLFFIPGEKSAPVAVVLAGGGFNAVCVMGEGFTTARELNKKGYNVFILKYRTRLDDTYEEGRDLAVEDLGNAISFIQNNMQTFGVTLDNYSLWGYSAGGTACQYFCMDVALGYKQRNLPKPTLNVLVYTGWNDENKELLKTQPATYYCYIKNDTVIGKENVKLIEQNIQTMQDLEIAVEVFSYENATHGFGAGIGTIAEGWMEKVYPFWDSLT